MLKARTPRKARGRASRLATAAILFLAGGAAFLFYGPFEEFRLLWINTAMYSSHCKFLARALYSPAYIAWALDLNRGGAEGKTESGPLFSPEKGAVPPAGPLPQEVVSAEIRGNHYRGYLVKIADPARISLVSSSLPQGELLEELTGKHNALGGVNATGYADDRMRGLPAGMLIVDGEVKNRSFSGGRHVMGGFRADHKLIVGAFTRAEIAVQGYVWAFEFGPLLVVNGEKTGLNAFSGGLSPRTAIGQSADGSVLLLVIDGRQPGSIGATYQDVQTVLYANGAVNAIGLDGGSSSSLVLEGRLINSPSGGEGERLLPNAIIF
jgi:exopolysaccharide biosynthesis protein